MSNIEKISNVNITGFEDLITPTEIKKLLPATPAQLETVLKGRQTIEAILDDRDPRLFVVVGPCSIHDPKAALEYAGRLAALSKKVGDKIFIVMRVYFEKPRTTTGWKGLINDPFLDDSFHIEEGLKIARKVLLDIASLGLSSGTEALDPISPQYLSELVSWAAIGARTTESQTHREMASGLSMPVGIKNGTDGNIQIALNALTSIKRSHHFLGINTFGKICKFSTAGNRYAHIVLRGGGGKTNYDASSIEACRKALAENDLRQKIVIDCSHANSQKDPKKQAKVLEDGILQVVAGDKAIAGFMIESHLFEGNQDIPSDHNDLRYGVSITDKCIGWETTEKILLEAHARLSGRS